MSLNQQPQSRSRQPAGIPVGGQFAASARTESEVTLGADTGPHGGTDTSVAPDHFVYPEITDAQHGDEFLQGQTWHRIADAKVFADDTMIKVDFVHGGGVTLPTAHKPRIRRVAVPVEKEQAFSRAQAAADAVGEAMYGSGQQASRADAAARAAEMVTAARDLRAHLSAEDVPALDAALAQFRMAQSSDGSHPEGAMNVLHAEMVDALEQNVPTRADTIARAVQVDATLRHLRETAVARDMGVASEEEVAEARRRHGDEVSGLRVATESRRRARQRRLLAGRPTINDLQEAQALADQARTERRDAVNAADRARGSYAYTPPDAADFDRRRLAADDATRTEGEKEHAYERAKRELDVGNAAWAKRNRIGAS